MRNHRSLLDIIEAKDRRAFIEVIDEAFKAAARAASSRSHALGLDVADGRVEEERRGTPVQ